MRVLNCNREEIGHGMCSFKDAIIKMIYFYFIFDICYSKSLYPILIFIQCYILGIKDKQAGQLSTDSCFIAIQSV